MCQTNLEVMIEKEDDMVVLMSNRILEICKKDLLDKRDIKAIEDYNHVFYCEIAKLEDHILKLLIDIKQQKLDIEAYIPVIKIRTKVHSLSLKVREAIEKYFLD